MFGKGISLFRLAGFQIHVNLSWLILAFLVTSTLAVIEIANGFGMRGVACDVTPNDGSADYLRSLAAGQGENVIASGEEKGKETS